ncbi:sugar transferase [Brevirhabdus sp.]|uniref:sugar transferase n=1 Tax=Brevirhabdus sp. TaxID=2004514 RepID=UPI0040599D7A
MVGFDFALKRLFDIVVAALGLALLWPVIAVTWYMAGRDTGASGFFCQQRVGRGGKLFKVVKLRTMRPVAGTTVTQAGDVRITRLGAKLRRYKLDELPQLWNVLIGNMSFVGPRPDVPGFMDQLPGSDRKILMLRPGITGPATLKYRNEEVLLAGVDDPERYNAEVIWPDKVRINLEYLNDWSFRKDIGYIVKTVLR